MSDCFAAHVWVYVLLTLYGNFCFNLFTACCCLWSMLTTVIRIWPPLCRKQRHVAENNDMSQSFLFYDGFVWKLLPAKKMPFLAQKLLASAKKHSVGRRPADKTPAGGKPPVRNPDGNKTNPLNLKVVYPNLKLEFLPYAVFYAGVVFEFHAHYLILVMHNLLEQNAPMHTSLPIDNFIVSHYLLHAWRTVTATARLYIRNSSRSSGTLTW